MWLSAAMLLGGALVAAAAPPAPVMLLGPTANLQEPDLAGGVASAEIVRQLLELVDSTGA